MAELKEQQAKMANMQNAVANGDLKSGYEPFMLFPTLGVG
jgi:hypothetical protein